MGCCLSRRSWAYDFKNSIRLVHLNGYVEEFEHPVKVKEVIGKPAKHFVFTHTQLVSSAGSEHLKPDTILEAGQVYFLLPHSIFESCNVSLMDLAPIATKLSAIAKNVHSGRKFSSNLHGARAIKIKSSSPNCPNRFSDRFVKLEPGNNVVAYINMQRLPSKSRSSWKPILATIRELSFHRSESETQEEGFEKQNE